MCSKERLCCRTFIRLSTLHEIINYQNYRFEILEMTSRRIQKVKVTILPVAQEEDEVKEK